MVADPTLDQLANFAAVMVFGPAGDRDLVRAMFKSNPELVDLWREHHAEFQRRADALTASGPVSEKEGSHD